MRRSVRDCPAAGCFPRFSTTGSDGPRGSRGRSRTVPRHAVARPPVPHLRARARFRPWHARTTLTRSTATHASTTPPGPRFSGTPAAKPRPALGDRRLAAFPPDCGPPPRSSSEPAPLSGPLRRTRQLVARGIPGTSRYPRLRPSPARLHGRRSTRMRHTKRCDRSAMGKRLDASTGRGFEVHRHVDRPSRFASALTIGERQPGRFPEPLTVHGGAVTRVLRSTSHDAR
jgi:hypothetical protein